MKAWRLDWMPVTVPLVADVTGVNGLISVQRNKIAMTTAVAVVV